MDSSDESQQPQSMDMAMMTQFFRKAMGFQGIPPNRLVKFKGSPRRPGDLSLLEWLDEFNEAVESYSLTDKEKAKALIDHLTEAAKEEILCLSEEGRSKSTDVINALKLCFGTDETVKSLSSTFYNSVQREGESLMDFSRSLLRLYSRMEATAPTEKDREALRQLRDRALRDQFVRGARETWVRRELRRIDLATTTNGDVSPFEVMRKEALLLFNDTETVRTPRVRLAHLESNVETTQNKSEELYHDSALHKEVMQLRAEVTALKSTVGELRDMVQLLNRPKQHLSNNECYTCGKKGHFSRDCPQKDSRGNRGYRGRGQQFGPQWNPPRIQAEPFIPQWNPPRMYVDQPHWNPPSRAQPVLSDPIDSTSLNPSQAPQVPGN